MDASALMVCSRPDPGASVLAGRTPDRRLVTIAWNAPLEAFAGKPLVCRRLDGLPDAADDLARRMLSRGEWEYWTSMRAVEKRRREWLMGRLTAKEAVCLLMEQYWNEELATAEVEIMPDSYGRPEVAGAWVDRLAARPVVSISHSDGIATALAALDSRYLVGIDLEHVSRRREDFEAIAFSPDERDMVAAMPEESRQEWALRLWCAKESLAKALGRGFSPGIQTYHVTAANLTSGEVRLALRNNTFQDFPHLRDQSMIAYTAREGDFVFSTIVFRGAAA